MPPPDPQLDDRRFQDIVDEAKTLIPRYCPEWTDHNASDPGVTLIELFAWMTDLTLYRLNRVPEKNYLRFMELLGIRLKQPVAARTDITIALSAAQPAPSPSPAAQRWAPSARATSLRRSSARTTTSRSCRPRSSAA